MDITINITSNFKSVQDYTKGIIEKLVENSDPILIAAATGVLGEVTNRIHTRGQKTNNSEIGSYKDSYMYTREKNNRGSSRNIIFSITRQMENDFTVVSTGNRVGLGFNNDTNFKKATYLEQRFPGTYTLSAEEQLIVVRVIDAYLNGILN